MPSTTKGTPRKFQAAAYGLSLCWVLHQRLGEQRIEQRRLARLRRQLQLGAVRERLGPRDLLARSQAHLQHQQADDARDEQHLDQGNAALPVHSGPMKRRKVTSARSGTNTTACWPPMSMEIRCG